MKHDPELLVQPAPFLRPTVSTPRIMGDVLIALLPPLVVGVWWFGISALLVVLVTTASAVVTEWLLGSGPRGLSLRDGSAVVTGVLLALTLPPVFPLWMAALGGFVAVALGKAAWGGLGHNLFNPSLVGRAFLQAAFPVAITTWTLDRARWVVDPALLAWPLRTGVIDGITAATPLGQMKFLAQPTGIKALLLGTVGGSIGETSAVAILLGGLYLIARRAADWRPAVAMVAAVAVASELAHRVAPDRLPGAAFSVFAGGLLFGAVYMATDPVTTPVSPRGALVFGAGAGFLVVLIRFWGGLPEGVMYAILLMNAASPLIDRSLQPRAFGHRGAR